MQFCELLFRVNLDGGSGAFETLFFIGLLLLGGIAASTLRTTGRLSLNARSFRTAGLHG